MKGIDPQNDLAPSPTNQNLNRLFRDELNLSTIDSPNNRKQRTVENFQVENQNLYGSWSNVNIIVIEGVLRPSVLQRFRDQTLPGFYLTQKNTNDVVDNPNYQPTYGSDKVHNPYRVGLDLTAQDDQGEFNSRTTILQLDTGSGFTDDTPI